VAALPEPLPDDLPEVPKFNAEEMLPPPLLASLVDIADRSQAAIEFPAVTAITALSSVIGRRVGIYPKRHDDWLVVPNLWGLCMGRRAF
jgi:hypothetical protein